MANPRPISFFAGVLGSREDLLKRIGDADKVFFGNAGPVVLTSMKIISGAMPGMTRTDTSRAR